MSNLEQRVAELEAFVAQLRGAITGGQHRTVHNGVPAASSAGEVASDDLMSRDWADMLIRKDPPRATESFAGKRMSECTEAYLLEYAAFHDWKAKKGREEEPPRLNNKGEPWWKSDELTAKVARGWAKRAKGGTAKPKAPAPKPANTPEDFDELPF
jgi:hypothetical protein